jgi:drug/metabolite transporter (DMT)-like permease
MKKHHLFVYIQLCIVAILWGGTFVAGRFIQNEIPSLLSATLRFLLGTIAFLILLSLPKVGWKKITVQQFWPILLLGFAGVFLYHLFFFYGLQLIPASRAALIVSLNPAMIAFLSFLIWREKITIQKSYGIALSIIGAIMVLLSHTNMQDTSSSIIGDLAIFGCVITWGIYTVAGKNTIKSIGALHTVAYSIFVGTILLFTASLISPSVSIEHISLLTQSDILSLLYLGILGSALAYVWYYQGIDQIGAANAGTFIALNPLTAVIAGYLLLNESISPSIILGSIFIVIGIILTNRPSKLSAQHHENKV